MVSEERGKLSLGLLATGIGAVGIISSLFLWHDTPDTVRLMGAYSRDLAGIGGASAVFSGLSLLQEVGMNLHFRPFPKGKNPTLLLVVASFSLLSVALALVSYLATVTISIQP